MARYISTKTHVGSITTTSQLGMAGYIPSRNGRVHLGHDTCWQRHNHILARNGWVHLVQEWPGTSRPTTLFLSFILDFTHFSLLFHFVHYETGGAGVGVWPGTSRTNKTEIAGITPAHVWGTFVVAQSLGYLLFTFSPTQHRVPNKCNGKIYLSPSWPSTSRPKGVAEHVIMTQRYRGAACNLSQKKRSWYLAKYRLANPTKEGVDIWRSTDEQTPKKEGVDIWEVQTAKLQKGRGWSLTKVQTDKSQNGKSWSLTKTQKNNLSQ